MSNNPSVVFNLCPDCGEEYFTESVHMITCPAKTSPEDAEAIKKELDTPGGIDMEDVSGEEDRVPEELLADARVVEISQIITPPAPVADYAPMPSGSLVYRDREELDTEFTCSFCEAKVIQDAEDTIRLDLDANPVCSLLCEEASNKRIIDARNHALEVADAIKAYVELDLVEHEHKAYYKERKAAFVRLQELIGVGGHFQDAAGTVYEVAAKTGQWVDFTPFEIHRTRRDTDASGKGSLTLDRAEELGYEVERKKAKPRKTPRPDDMAGTQGGGE
jgi:hypothetical protein